MSAAKQPLIEATKEVQATSFLDYRLYLDAVYMQVKQRQARYTYKIFAADLGFGATTIMHQIIRAYRPLTAKAAEKIQAALDLRGVEASYFRALISYCNARTPSERETYFAELLQLKRQVLTTEMDQALLEYFSDWRHAAIREMVAMSNFKNDPVWIAAQLLPGVRPEQVRKSLALLASLGYIAHDAEHDTYVQTQSHITTGDRVRGMGLLSFHQQMIDLGRDAMVTVKAKRRNIGALTLCCDEETASRLKVMINMFQMQLVAEAEKTNRKDQIYQVNFQMFPFTALSTPPEDKAD